MKTLGTIAGGILGIVIWEITQGNSYGIGVVMYISSLAVRIFCIVTTITLILVVVYEYQIQILADVVAASILSTIPEPHAGRVELLHGNLPRNKLKDFVVSMGLNIRHQIADERLFLAHTRFEPPLRGRFPIKVYKIVLEKVNNMADLVTDMASRIKYENNKATYYQQH
ncbi:hypothetical protein BDC45DRAFT_583069 [Circinella umbellata]|nr:hypothetical protein BDC45DRAFT_534559 [Circinella umbellata]KAI7855316.1 hypothetical protein BDC45DRAFT_583069 [Circinella umbellata]